jgi:NAD(P)-dependent dehydrogenase (short-subunit alcohol dehydrogenase family)
MTANAPTALITGGTSGIGRAAANKMALLGIHVLVVGRSMERGERTVAEIRAAGGKADFISSDLRDASSTREVAKRAIELGKSHVDILINNAGIFPFGPTNKTTEEEFDRVYSLNVKAPYFLVAELAPLMARRGKGAIVNVSTMVADYGVSGISSQFWRPAMSTTHWAGQHRAPLTGQAVSPRPYQRSTTIRSDRAVYQADPETLVVGRVAPPDSVRTRLRLGPWPTSPDGSKIYIGSGPPNSSRAILYEIEEYDTKSWIRTRTLTTSVGFWNLAISPDGRCLYAVGGPAGNHIIVVDLTTYREPNNQRFRKGSRVGRRGAGSTLILSTILLPDRGQRRAFGRSSAQKV